jgi:hypothetical protein
MSAMVDAGGRFERGVGAFDDHAEAVAFGRPHQAAGRLAVGSARAE